MEVLEELARIETYLLGITPMEYVRDLENRIDWDLPLIGIVGARGVGKTTIVLQHLKKIGANPDRHLYLSADNPLVLRSSVYDIGSTHFMSGGVTLIVDEVHKYPDWSIEIKALHDSFPNRKIVILGSSKLSMILGKGDLSRRMRIYEMEPLSFREYLEMMGYKDLPKLSFEELIQQHVKISSKIVGRIPDILMLFKKYLSWGCFPFFKLVKTAEDYTAILRSVLDKVVYEDITSVRSLRFPTIASLKKLLAFIATSPSPQISIGSLTKDLSISRETLYDLLEILETSDVVRIVRRKEGKLQGSKVFLYTPDLYYSVSSSPSVGTIREAFFAMNFDDLRTCGRGNCDFIVEGMSVEIGGRTKSSSADLVFKDGVDIGYRNSIPLYLVGFLK